MNPEAITSVTTALGRIEIKPQVVFSLALDAALSTYGVVGIASRYTGFDVTRRDPHRGIEVHNTCVDAGTENDVTRVTVDIHIIVEYGVRIHAVTSSLQHQVSYCIEHSTGYQVDAVNVHVAGLHVTHED
jgi:uncharacterized alkaline shock family protein YloU